MLSDQVKIQVCWITVKIKVAAQQVLNPCVNVRILSLCLSTKLLQDMFDVDALITLHLSAPHTEMDAVDIRSKHFAHNFCWYWNPGLTILVREDLTCRSVFGVHFDILDVLARAGSHERLQKNAW